MSGAWDELLRRASAAAAGVPFKAPPGQPPAPLQQLHEDDTSAALRVLHSAVSAEAPPDEPFDGGGSPASTLSRCSDSASPEYDAVAVNTEPSAAAVDPWQELTRAAAATTPAATATSAGASGRSRSRSRERVPVQPALSPPWRLRVPPPPPPPSVRPAAKPEPSWSGAYWRANSQRYGARGGLKNPTVQWHTMRAKAQRDGWLDDFERDYPKPKKS